MSTPRRQIVRPPATSPDSTRRHQQLQKLRSKLDRERIALTRWQKRLCRAFNAVQKQQVRIARLERQLHRLQENNGHD